MIALTKKRLAARIKKIRLDRGLTQREAAKKCNIDFKYYQEHESSKPRDMKLSTLLKIARGFDMSVSELLDFE